MSARLDRVDATLSASSQELHEIGQQVTRADIDALMLSDIPLEAKSTRLTGLVEILDREARVDLREYTREQLQRVVSTAPDPIVPLVES